MADPRNAGRAIPLTGMRAAIAAAAGVAAARAATQPNTWWDEGPTQPPVPSQLPAAPLQARKFFNPGTGDEMSEWEYEQWMQEEEEAKTADKSAARDREARRDEMQYKTAFKTAFELGMKAGRMQRSEPAPCSACERRKERNRIAAQASRLEKKRQERTLAGIKEDAPRFVRPRVTGGVPPSLPPPPSVPVGGIKIESDSEEDEVEQPPF